MKTFEYRPATRSGFVSMVSEAAGRIPMRVHVRAVKLPALASTRFEILVGPYAARGDSRTTTLSDWLAGDRRNGITALATVGRELLEFAHTVNEARVAIRDLVDP